MPVPYNDGEKTEESEEIMDGKTLYEFEEKNRDWLTEKFMKIPKILDEWAQFVEDEYSKSVPDEDIGRDR